MADKTARVRILLADSQSLFREAMRAVLEGQPDFEVVAVASEGLEALAEAERTAPDVALLDAGMPNCDGVRAAALIRSRVATCRVVILADVADPALLLDAVEAGASGYLTKDCPLAELIQATRSIHRGETLIPTRMLGPLLNRLIRRHREQDQALLQVSRLTRREKEVLALLADGAHNESIALALVISPQTARTHVQNVLAKLEVHSRLEAAAFVTRNGILSDLMEGKDGRFPP
ncbi:MAG: response regulator [Actinomycetota bacterium]